MVLGAPTVSSAKPRMRGVTAGEEALAGGKVLDEDRVAVLVHARTLETVGKADGRSRCEHDAPAAGEPVEREHLQVGLHEADLPAEGASRQAALRAHERSPLRIEHVISRIARDRSGNRGEPDAREEPVDRRLILLAQPLVERVR